MGLGERVADRLVGADRPVEHDRAPWRSATARRSAASPIPHAVAASRIRSGLSPCSRCRKPLALLAHAAASPRRGGRRRRPRTTRPRCGRPWGSAGCRRSRGRGRRGTASARRSRFASSWSVRASRSTTSDSSAFDVQILRPLTIQPPLPSRSARVVIATCRCRRRARSRRTRRAGHRPRRGGGTSSFSRSLPNFTTGFSPNIVRCIERAAVHRRAATRRSR